ncbi:patatin-like phospholipase family protein [Methylobacterium sp. P31]
MWFHAFESAHARTILVAPELDCPWCQVCLHHADHILLVAQPGEAVLPGVAECLTHIPAEWIRIDLVVHQEPGINLPRPVHPELDALPISMRIHVREGNVADHHRLARLATGSARGLVLGGGGARGLAHLGVLQALDEAGFVVDFVGGTSMGAVIAASFATGTSLDRIRSWAAEDFSGRNPLNDYTLPYVALTRGARVDAALARRFGNVRIEQLWLPFFCVSSNLSTGEIRVHDKGGLAEALRASIAVPGLLPPVSTNEGVLVDGGMMNNLPADVMADLERGSVLAIDVGSDLAFRETPRRSWRGHLLRKWLGVPEAIPAMAPLLLRAATVSGDAQTMRAVSQATAVLKPPLAGIDLRAWRSLEEAAEARLSLYPHGDCGRAAETMVGRAEGQRRRAVRRNRRRNRRDVSDLGAFAAAAHGESCSAKPRAHCAMDRGRTSRLNGRQSFRWPARARERCAFTAQLPEPPPAGNLFHVSRSRSEVAPRGSLETTVRAETKVRFSAFDRRKRRAALRCRSRMPDVPVTVEDLFGPDTSTDVRLLVGIVRDLLQLKEGAAPVTNAEASLRQWEDWT